MTINANAQSILNVIARSTKDMSVTVKEAAIEASKVAALASAKGSIIASQHVAKATASFANVCDSKSQALATWILKQ